MVCAVCSAPSLSTPAQSEPPPPSDSANQLLIISYSDPLERIMNMYQELGRDAQVTLLIGDHLGDLRTLVDRYLPKSAIDRTTFRMADLLRARWSAFQDGSDAGGSNEVKGEDPES